jgi:tetratricopeptide (TPR) repeat protein
MKAFLNEQPLRTAMNRGIGVAASVPGVQELGTKIGEGIYNLLNKGDVGQLTVSPQTSAKFMLYSDPPGTPGRTAIGMVDPNDTKHYGGYDAQGRERNHNPASDEYDPFSNFQKGSYGDPNYQKPTMADVAGAAKTDPRAGIKEAFLNERLTTGPSQDQLFTSVVPDYDRYGTYTGEDQLIKDYAAAGLGTPTANLVKLPEGHPYADSGSGYYEYNGTDFTKIADLNMTPEYEKMIRSNYNLNQINQNTVPRKITQDDIDTANFFGPMYTGFDYSKENNWSPGQPAPDGYRVAEMLGDQFLERMYPSKEEVARLPGPGIVGPMGLMGLMGPEMMPSVNIPQDPDAGLSGQEYAEKYGLEYASGGRVGFALGSLPKGIQALAKQLNKKFGKGTIKTADEMERPKSVKEKEMFEEFEARNPDPKRKLTDDEIKDYEEELGDSETWMSEGTVEEAEQALKRQKEYEAAMYTDYKAGRLDPQPGEKGRKEFLEKKLEEMEMSGDKKIMSVDEIEELSNMDLEAEMNVAKSLAPKMVERFELKQKYPGITDELLDKILIDDNMQRKAEVLATIDEAFKMLEKGMGHDEVLDTLKNVTRTKQAGGGLAYLMGL